MDRRVTLRTSEKDTGRRLDEVLRAALAEAGLPVSKAALRTLVMAGAVRVDGRPARTPGRIVGAGLRLEARVDPGRLGAGRAASVRRPAPLSVPVLFEDEALLAVDKPPGLPTVPTADPSRASLVSVLAGMRGAEAYLAVHQRLDRDTSGVVLFAKDEAANPGLAAAFAGHAVEKVYHALTARPREGPPRRWRTVSRLARAGRGRQASVTAGGQRAETTFERLESWPRALLVEARPLTGRTHQIRVHLRDAGLPILGDLVYGTARRGALRVGRLMLHAHRLALRHPVTGRRIEIVSPYPPDFRRVLQSLRETRAGRDMK
jgi:RluA family pseudouridine synthase